MTKTQGIAYRFIGSILIVIGVLLVAFPFYPLVWYSFTQRTETQPQPQIFSEQDFVGTDEQLPEIGDVTQVQDSPKPLSRIVIDKIGVDMPIVEGSASALEKGAWRLPLSAHPDQIGNTILTAHRYKYRPPSSKTFYLLDKLAVGDTFTVYWNGGEYRYAVDKREIKSPDDPTLLLDTYDRRVTLITCDPLFSTKNRLVVSGRLLRK